jgi:hypothetical protein
MGVEKSSFVHEIFSSRSLKEKLILCQENLSGFTITKTKVRHAKERIPFLQMKNKLMSLYRQTILIRKMTLTKQFQHFLQQRKDSSPNL